MRKSNFALRLQPSLMKELKRVVEDEETSVNQFINLAIAEKLASMRTAEAFFEARATSGDPERALEILRRIGSDQPPVPGDERSS